MQCGVLQFFGWPERRVLLPTVYERAMQRIAIMDQTGYDAVWLAEHHFTSYSSGGSGPRASGSQVDGERVCQPHHSP